MDRERPDVRATACLEITVNLPVLLSDRTGLLGTTGALSAGLHTATTGRERFSVIR